MELTSSLELVKVFTMPTAVVDGSGNDCGNGGGNVDQAPRSPPDKVYNCDSLDILRFRDCALTIMDVKLCIIITHHKNMQLQILSV